MPVHYVKLEFASRDHEHVSRQWFYLLRDLHEDGVQFNVNEGHRTMKRQRVLVRLKGAFSASNPTGAAAPSRTAPHIRTGKPNHAIDFDNAAGVVSAAGKRGVRLYRPISTEPWHVDPDAGDLRRYYLKVRRAEARAKARKAAAKAKAAVKPATRTSRKGVAFIAGFEGCVLRPYQDAVGVWTIGYGHTSGVTARTRPLKDKAVALELLKNDIARRYEPAVKAAFQRCRIRPTQGEFDATVSAVYNLGPGILEKDRTFGGALDRRDLKGAADALLLYVKAGNKTLPGLVTRRKAERARFLSG